MRKLKTLLAASAHDIGALTGKELRSAYKSAAASVRGRSAAFKAAGKVSALPARYRSGVATLGTFGSEGEMRKALREALGYLRGDVSTLSGYERVMSERAREVGERLGLDFEDEDDYKSFGDFMGEMQTRLKSMWKPASDFVVDLYKQSKRLNLDPMQLMKNYEYWRDHLEDLENMDPIQGRSRELRPSDYIKKAKLETITDYYKKSTSHDIISKAARKPSRGRRKK